MAYITLPELAERPGPRELAQLGSTREHDVRDLVLMDATLRGLDRSAWSPEEIADADAAAARISDAVREADALIDGFLAQRYVLPLQLPPTSTGKNVVTSWSRAITRYLLNKDRVTQEATDPVVRDYKDALRLLQLAADGKFSLGETDPIAGSRTSPTDVRITGAPNAFGRKQLRHFR